MQMEVSVDLNLFGGGSSDRAASAGSVRRSGEIDFDVGRRPGSFH